MDEAKRATGLVLAPFNGAWGGVHGAVSTALEAKGVNLSWLNAGADIDAETTPRIHELLDDADFVVADLTEAEPNVMYEMGYAHALRRPVFPVIERRRQKVPAAVHGRLYFVYDAVNPADLVRFLEWWTAQHVAEPRVEE